MSPEEIESGNVVRLHVLKKFDEYLNSAKEITYQTETICLDMKRICAWSIISDWSNFKKLVPFIADEVVYDGNSHTVGSKLTLKWVKKNVECFLKVSQVNCDKKSDVWKYAMTCIKPTPEVPNQEIHFKIIKTSESSCFLEFKHIFKQRVNKEIIDIIAKDKKKILLSLKENFSKLVSSKKK